jgi:hypothetical protein
MYEFKWRMADPQTGRFWQIDPLAEDYVYNSTYAFSENKVTTHVELEGLEAVWADNNVERDVRDVSSGKISTAQLEDRAAVREGASNAFTIAAAIGGTIAAGIMVPGFAQAASLVMAAEIFGVPSPGAPTSVISTVASETNTVVNEVKTATQEIKAVAGEVKVGPYANLKDAKTVGEGKNFTQTQKQAIINANKANNSGVIKSDQTGKILDPAVQSKKGVSANMNQAEIDHITPKAKGGGNSNTNAQVLSKEENLKKGRN